MVDHVPQNICNYIRLQSKQELFNVIDYHINGTMNSSIPSTTLITILIHQYQGLFKKIISTFDPSVTMIVIPVPHRILNITKDQLLDLCPLSEYTAQWNIVCNSTIETKFTLIIFLLKQVYDTEYVDARISPTGIICQ